MAITFRMFLAVLVFGVVVAGGKFAFAAEDFAPATKSLFLAVKKNNLGAVKRSLLDGADVTVETSAGLTAIDIAIDKGYFPIAHYLLAWRRHLRPKLSRPTPVLQLVARERLRERRRAILGVEKIRALWHPCRIVDSDLSAAHDTMAIQAERLDTILFRRCEVCLRLEQGEEDRITAGHALGRDAPFGVRREIDLLKP